MMELSSPSCCSADDSILPPAPAEHTDKELSTARPSASSTSLSIRSLRTQPTLTFFETHITQQAKSTNFASQHLRHTRITTVLLLAESVLLSKVVKTFRLFPHVIKSHTFCYSPCLNLKKKNKAMRI